MFTYDIIEVTKKDSLDLTDEDRSTILKVVQEQSANRIVITHGTDTMIRTAEVLSQVKEKVIILTGSMLPEKFATSDARFNIGMAVGSIQVLSPGVYVALYGRVVPWEEFPALHEEYEEKARSK
jgi:L-asparaginase